ncbi:RHS repeat-associated core domain-containing protein [Kitasatospora sp. HPMI-4]|uniref:RHS repeat-associated core domain-containing protein n=1 Tax=Kitasatospora sp. HPMI-4 TaxID=3448443 RepID=UPI003F1BA919
MSNQIVKALEHAAEKIGATLAKDAGKAVKDLYHSAGQNLKKVANNVREVEEKHVADLRKLMEGGKKDVPHPRSSGGGGRHRGGPHPKGRGREQVRSPRIEGRRLDSRCGGGEPVDMATGRMYIDQVDVSLPGSLPLVFTRNFESGYAAGRWMGPRWVCTFDERLEIDDEGIVHIRADRITQAYPHPEPGDPVYASAGARWELALTDNGDYALKDPSTGVVREFALQPGAEEALLTQVRDRHGRRYTLAYDDDGTPLSITHSGGYRLLVTVDAGRITALRLAGGAEGGHDALLMRYGYTDGHLSSVYNSSGKPMRFINDASGRILSWIDRNDSQYLYQYDQFDRVIDEGGADGTLRFHFTYGTPDPDTGLKLHTETNALGHTTTYTVNEHAQVTAITDPLGHTTHYERDEYDRLLAETDPLGRTTRYEYDGAGDLISVTDPDGGRSTAVLSDTLGLPVQVTEPGNALWINTYDEFGRRTSLTDPVGATTSYGYDDLGHLVSVSNALGGTTQVRRNSAGLPVEVTDPAGATTRFEHDAFGRSVAVTDPLGHTTLMTWTVEGYLKSRTAPDGTVESWQYDGEGNLRSHTDALGRLSTFEYTHFETLASATGPDGARYAFTYDANMQLTGATNAAGQTWEYSYDAAGRLIAEHDFDGRGVTYELDAAGQIVSRANAMGQQIRYAYDLLGRITHKDTGFGVVGYEYDPAGNLIQANGPDASVTRTLDAVGNLLSESVNGRVLAYDRDVLGRPTRRTTPQGHVSNWAYDTAGRTATLTVAGRTIDFTYDPAGREQQRMYTESLVLTNTWGPRSRLARQSARAVSQPQGSALLQRSYAYRDDGNLVAIDDHRTGRRTFALDRAGRVTGVQADNWTELYSYDQDGNLVEADWPGTNSARAAVGERQYQGTRLQSAGRVRYEYDAAGRVTLRQRARLSRKPHNWRYTWDAEGRLTQVITPDGARWRYLYDPFGRRIAKYRLGPDGSAVEERVEFSWDGATLAEQTTYAPYLPGPYTLSWDHEEFHPLAQTEKITIPDPAGDAQDRIDSKFFAIVTDLVGAPTELIDPSTDSIAWSATKTLWGHTTWPAESLTNTPLRFPGQYFDPETRLHYNVNRYYDPETARYTSPDPLGPAASGNPYAYVHNPHTWSDPLGLSPHQHDDLLDAVHAQADESSKVRPNRNTPGTAEGLKLPNGKITTSPSIKGAAPVLHPDVQAILDTVQIPGDGHGKCGLPTLLTDALNNGDDPTGSAAAAVIIRSNKEHPKHRHPIGPCKSCRPLKDHYDLDFITDDGM